MSGILTFECVEEIYQNHGKLYKTKINVKIKMLNKKIKDICREMTDTKRQTITCAIAVFKKSSYTTGNDREVREWLRYYEIEKKKIIKS